MPRPTRFLAQTQRHYSTARACYRVLLTAFLLVLITARTQAQYVHTHGKQILDGTNQLLRLKGINLGNWLLTEGYMWRFDDGPQSEREIEELTTDLLGPTAAARFWQSYRDAYITDDDLHRIRQLGFNSVRVPLHSKLFTNDGAEGFTRLDHLLATCRREGLLVVLDLHAAPGGQTGSNIDDSNGWPWLFQDAAAQQQTIDLWRRIARRYRNHPEVLGFDLLNEPLPQWPQLHPLYAELEPLYKRITAAIRAEDPNHSIILEAARWDTDFSVYSQPFDGNLIYEFHTYWTAPDQTAIQPYLDFREAHNVPIWLGESGENTDAWVATFARFVETKDIGWAFWPYKKMEALSSPVTFARPPHWDEVTTYAKFTRNMGKMEDRIKLRPSDEAIHAAFDGLLRNIAFSQERINPGYTHALLPNAPVR